MSQMPQRMRNFTLLTNGNDVQTAKKQLDKFEEISLDENTRPKGTTPLKKMM